jgi:hypothetical protein
MVKLKANFESDGIAHLRAHMIQVQGWGATEVGRLDDRDVRNYFFEARRRRLAPQARVLKIADDFQCPPVRGSRLEGASKGNYIFDSLVLSC